MQWAKRYDGFYSEDKAHAIAVDDMYVYVTGFSKGDDTDFDYLTLSYAKSDGMQAGMALYDGVYKGLELTQSEDQLRSRAVIALTDGSDNSSTYTYNNVTTYANQEKLTIYTVGLGSSVSEDILKDMAADTNGLYFLAPDSSQLQDIYEIISGIQ